MEVEGGRLTGFAIGRPTRAALGLDALVITEVFVREPSVDRIHALLRAAIRGTRCHYLIAHFAEGTMERSALRRAGFVRARNRGYTWTARPLGTMKPDPLRPDSWDLTVGEMEIF